MRTTDRLQNILTVAPPPATPETLRRELVQRLSRAAVLVDKVLAGFHALPARRVDDAKRVLVWTQPWYSLPLPCYGEEGTLKTYREN
jgi:hypothetical protein